MIQDVLENLDDDVSNMSIFDQVEGLYDDLAESRSNTIKRAPQTSATPVKQQQDLDSATEEAEGAQKREPLLSPSRAINSYTHLYKQDANDCD